ncbi:MAG: methyltransferase [Candidatus Micrarchaeota archaeon]|nr:methyltransferase [Candidatus Micrarchaeota archaeon]
MADKEKPRRYWLDRHRNPGEKQAAKRSYMDEMRLILTKEELGELSKGFDLLGNIAIIDFTDRLKKRSKEIAGVILKYNKNVDTVVAKAGPVEGVFRTRKYRYVAGKRSFIASYRENGCTFVFDIRKTYFSPRWSFERSRLMAMVRPKESVVVMFAGVGPFAIEIAKAHKDARVTGIELNEYACKAFADNIKLNKVPNVTCIHGDVSKASKNPALKNSADRIIMPLPMSSLQFLDDVLRIAKRKCTVHIYALGMIEHGGDSIWRAISAHAEKNGYRVKKIFSRVARPYSAREQEMVIDYSISK